MGGSLQSDFDASFRLFSSPRGGEDAEGTSHLFPDIGSESAAMVSLSSAPAEPSMFSCSDEVDAPFGVLSVSGRVDDINLWLLLLSGNGV